ncbi:MAG: HEPN domain-containing protein [Bacilli bacterium]|nr:HEPN domain-containing protein [Bacilli bacterium]
MNIFKNFGNELSYKDIIQLDGAFSVAHINYGKSPIFNGINSKDITKRSRKNSLSAKEKIEDVIGCIESFDGTEKNFKKADRILLWENYWLEYIIAFDKLVEILPNSIVTIYLGRQAIEIGLKYLLLKNSGKIAKTHDLKELADLLYSKYIINDDYMEYVDIFCEKYCKYIEGGNVEYFRFPEYKENKFFAGNSLDIKWLSYNFTLILLKLIHFANLDDKI